MNMLTLAGSAFWAWGCHSEPTIKQPFPEDSEVPDEEDTEDVAIPGPEDIELSIASPAAGTWTEDGTITASGLVEGLTDVTVNGEPVSVDGGTWSTTVATVPGIVPIEVTSIDDSGFSHVRRRSVLAGSFHADTVQTGNAVRMRVNQSAIDQGFAALPGYFSQEYVEKALLADSRIYADSLFWVYLTSVDFDTSTMDFALSEGAISLSVLLPELALTFWYDGPSFLNGVAEAGASMVRVDADLELSIEDGALAVSIPSATVVLDDFYFDVDNILGIEHLMQDAVQDALEDALEDALINEVAPLIEDSFVDLDMSYSNTLLNTDTSVEAAFTEFSIDEEGIELLVAISIDVQGLEQPPHIAPGWFAHTFEPDALSHDRDVAIALSDNLLNHILFCAWNAALLSDEVSTEDGSLSAVFLSLAGATEGTLIVDAMFPPVVVQSSEELQLQVGEISMIVETPGAPLGEYVALMIEGVLPIELMLQDNAMQISLGEPDVHLDASDNDWVMRPEEIETLLVEGLPLDILTDLATDIEVPIPTYQGAGISEGVLFRDGSATATVIEFDLE